MTFAATGPPRQISDDMTMQVHSTIRTSIFDNLNFTKPLQTLLSLAAGRTNTSSYNCDFFNHCNGRGVWNLIERTIVPASNSALRKVTGTNVYNYTISNEGYKQTLSLITNFDFSSDECYFGLFWFNGVHYGIRDYCFAIIIDYSFTMWWRDPSMEMEIFHDFVKMFPSTCGSTSVV
ncbi:unnamed protein product [Orchesella dallaii]|uniref:Uncharacterized protein n=1 Tax=Orchesella dallaii TaxID=48710 RepID=A0ABP1S0Y5_9HEXA